MLLIGAAHAQSVVRVEEDWELVVAEPAPVAFAPEVTTVMSPLSQLGNPSFYFTLNPGGKRDQDNGGLRLKLWRGGSPPVIQRTREGRALEHSGERVTWTQVLSVERGRLRFAIEDGHSRSWGAFGGEAALSMEITSSLANLDRYTPDLSILSSGLSGTLLSPPRVHQLTLVEVRTYSRAGLLSRSTSPAVVYAR
jgi:hypothetical protein